MIVWKVKLVSPYEFSNKFLITILILFIFLGTVDIFLIGTHFVDLEIIKVFPHSSTFFYLCGLIVSCLEILHWHIKATNGVELGSMQFIGKENSLGI